MRDPLLFGLGVTHDDAVSRQIMDIFRRILWWPMADVLRRATAQDVGNLSNAGEDALREALRSGRVQYESGVFSGDFNAAVSRAIRGMGATLDKRAKVFRLDQARVPGWVVAEATGYRDRAKQAHDLLLRTLADTESDLDARVAEIQVDASLAIGKLQSAWKDAATVLEVNPHLSPEMAEQLRRQYDDSLKLPIRDFLQEEVQRLRRAVRANAEQGYRFDRLVPALEARHDVSKSKAVFLARQETSLLVSKFRQARFQDVGATDYVWMTSHDGRVRDDHKGLDGKRFSYASPPITNKATGARNNPGEDFGCRCVARPVLLDSPARARNSQGVATRPRFDYDKPMNRSRTRSAA